MSAPTPTLTPVTRPYWDALSRGKLTFQHCETCGNCWLPAREACPACLADHPAWIDASGKGRVLSWVVYHTAYAEHLAARIPYNVAIVEIDEGPRLLTSIIDCDASNDLCIDMKVRLKMTKIDGIDLPYFARDDRA